MNLVKLFATGFYVGNIKYAPGTFGSLIAIPIWIVFLKFIAFPYYYFFLGTILLVVLFFVGTFLSDKFSIQTKTYDSSKIVIDEILGQLVSLFLTFPFFISFYNNDGIPYFIFLISNFILFRFFDIKKPLYIGVLEKKIQKGYGIMIDDLLAGITSAIIINIILCLSGYL